MAPTTAATLEATVKNIHLLALAAAALWACQEEGGLATPTAAPAGAAAPAADPDQIPLRLSLETGESWHEEVSQEMSFMGFFDWSTTTGMSYEVTAREGDRAKVSMATEWMRVESGPGALFDTEGEPFVMDTRDPESPDIWDLVFGPAEAAMEGWSGEAHGSHDEEMTEEEHRAKHAEHHPDEPEGFHGDATMEEIHAWHHENDGHGDGGHHGEGDHHEHDGQHGEGRHDKHPMGLPTGMEDLEELMDFENFLGVPIEMWVDSRRRVTGVDPGEFSELFGEEGMMAGFDPMTFLEAIPEGWSFGQDFLTFPEESVSLGDSWATSSTLEWSGEDMAEAIPEEVEGMDAKGVEEAFEMMAGMGMSLSMDLEHRAVSWWEGMLRISTTGTMSMTTKMDGVESFGPMGGDDGSFEVWVDVEGETLWHRSGYVAAYETTWTWRFAPDEPDVQEAAGFFGAMPAMTMTMEMTRLPAGEWSPIPEPEPAEG